MSTRYSIFPHCWHKTTRAHHHQWPIIIRSSYKLNCTRDHTYSLAIWTSRYFLWQKVSSVVGSKIEIVGINCSRHSDPHAHTSHSRTQIIKCYTTSCSKKGQWNGRYCFTSLQRWKIFFASNNLITYFNDHFLLPQNESWRKCHIPTEWLSRVIACLSGNQFEMVWLQRLPKIVKKNGIIGVTTPTYIQSILSSPTSPAPSNLMSLLQNSQLGSVQACMGKRYN